MIYLLLILLINLIYVPSIWYGVVNDDATDLKLNPYNVKRRKMFSVLLHLIVAEYIYFAFGTTSISFWAAILFSVHPLCVQVPIWTSGRFYGLNALVFLLILSFPYFGLPLYFLANLSIGTILFTPFVFMFTEFWYVSLLFPILALVSYKQIKGNVDFKIKGNIFSSPIPDDFKLNKFNWVNLIIVVKTFGYYSLACLLPIKNGFYNSFLTTLGASEKDTKYWYSLNRHFWGGLIAIVLMAVLWFINRNNHIGLGVMLFVCSIIPFLNIITVQQFTAPRYAYLPLIGFQIALVNLIFKLSIAPQYFILGALFLFYLDRTIKVMRHYKKDNITMIELDSQVFPDNPRVWYYRYEHMLSKKNPIMAWAEASYGLKHLPEDCQLWFGLSVASFELGDLNAAQEFLRTSQRFMMLTERNNMQSLILEMNARIKKALADKWKKGKV